jgi:hypothetical protein
MHVLRSQRGDEALVQVWWPSGCAVTLQQMLCLAKIRPAETDLDFGGL